MMNPNIHVRIYPGMGRGLTSSTSIKAGQHLMECELLVLDVTDTIYVNRTDLAYYTFKYSEQQDCLVLGLGEIFNHFATPNVMYQLEDKTQDGQTRKVMAFYAVKDIEAGEQLFIDYNADTAVNTNTYIATKSLIG